MKTYDTNSKAKQVLQELCGDCNELAKIGVEYVPTIRLNLLVNRLRHCGHKVDTVSRQDHLVDLYIDYNYDCTLKVYPDNSIMIL